MYMSVQSYSGVLTSFVYSTFARLFISHIYPTFVRLFLCFAYLSAFLVVLSSCMFFNHVYFILLCINLLTSRCQPLYQPIDIQVSTSCIALLFDLHCLQFHATVNNKGSCEQKILHTTLVQIAICTSTGSRWTRYSTS